MVDVGDALFRPTPGHRKPPERVHLSPSGGSCQTSPVSGLWRSHRNLLWAAWALTPSASPISVHVHPASIAVATAASRRGSSSARRAVIILMLSIAGRLLMAYQPGLMGWSLSKAVGPQRMGVCGQLLGDRLTAPMSSRFMARAASSVSASSVVSASSTATCFRRRALSASSSVQRCSDWSRSRP